MKKSKFRIILIVMGLLYLAAFLCIPYAKLEGLAGGLGQLAGSLGMGDMYPEKLTGLNMVKSASMVGADANFVIAFALMPVVLELVIVLFNLLGKKKLSYIGTILVSLVTLFPCGLNAALLPEDYRRLGYSFGPLAYILIVMIVAQVAVAIIGCVVDKSGSSVVGSSAGSGKASGSGKNVKVGKKDGKMTGVKGSYMGAEIPMKSGEQVVIGRDPAVCSIVIKDEKASRKHCMITYNADNGMYMVTDCSSNGTFRNGGQRLPENTAVPVSAGTTIQIGKDGDIFRLG